MEGIIRDGTGKGYNAKVDKENRLYVNSKSGSVQHTISIEEQQAYQVIGIASLSPGTVHALHLKNTSPDKAIVVTYFRHQIVGASGGSSFPNVNNYFSVGLGGVYSSGGSAAIPVNVASGSGNTADVSAYEGNPTLSGIIKEIDRWYTKANGDMNTFSKEGSVIILPGRSIQFSYIGDQTAGILYSRLSFYVQG